MKAKFTEKGFQKRLLTLKEARKKAIEMVSDLHVKIQKGNSKTGSNVYTISLMPVLDCTNCSNCMHNCYDLKADMIYKEVVNDRARNSAVHLVDPERFWNEIDIQVKANFVSFLRINVGGDLTDADFKHVADLANKNVKTTFLFFTKNYKGINKFLNSNEFPENVHPILSAWEGMDMDNPHELPMSHVLYEDGRTTAPKYGAYYCAGNCSECAFEDKGCWTLKSGEHVVFHAH